MRLYGLTAFRLFGFSAFRLFGFSAFRLFGFSAFRLFGETIGLGVGIVKRVGRIAVGEWAVEPVEPSAGWAGGPNSRGWVGGGTRIAV
jgi:hypothetical protein